MALCVVASALGGGGDCESDLTRTAISASEGCSETYSSGTPSVQLPHERFEGYRERLTVMARATMPKVSKKFLV